MWSDLYNLSHGGPVTVRKETFRGLLSAPLNLNSWGCCHSTGSAVKKISFSDLVDLITTITTILMAVPVTNRPYI